MRLPEPLKREEDHEKRIEDDPLEMLLIWSLKPQETFKRQFAISTRILPAHNDQPSGEQGNRKDAEGDRILPDHRYRPEPQEFPATSFRRKTSAA